MEMTMNEVQVQSMFLFNTNLKLYYILIPITKIT